MNTKQAEKNIPSQWCIINDKNSEKLASKHEDIKDYCCKAVIATCLEN